MLVDCSSAAAASADVSWNRRSKNKYTAWSIAKTALPCLGWLRGYKLREWLLVSFLMPPCFHVLFSGC
jgi:hypothetical protein